uniref:SHSP domain-containing protein n=1 Tax=Tetradesmus obliquus TaxID=3088 RepID=A0A383W5E9_TETOB|eukprot:jgi/Sobl393_1/10291/SZX72858.1
MALSLFGTSDPFFGQMERAMDRAFNRALTGRDIGALMPALTSSAGASTTGHPMDIIETKDAFELHCDAPGFSPADISVEMSEGMLTISGKRKEEKQEEREGKVVRRERHFSQFTRSIALPDAAKEDGITASLEKGVLRVTVPKAEPTPKPQPKRITVTGA